MNLTKLMLKEKKHLGDKKSVQFREERKFSVNSKENLEKKVFFKYCPKLLSRMITKTPSLLPLAAGKTIAKKNVVFFQYVQSISELKHETEIFRFYTALRGKN